MKIQNFVQELFIKDDYDDDFILQDFILPIQHVKVSFYFFFIKGTILLF